MLNLDQISTFIAVADHGSFTAAADAVGLTQPAVSMQIKLLEQDLGVRLIERVGRKAQPSAAGIEFLGHARRIAAETAVAREAMEPYREGSLGRVRIGSGGTASIHLLPLAIASLKRKIPGVDVVVRIGNTQEVLGDLEANGLDLAVVTLPASGRSLEAEPFFEEELMAVGPEGAEIPPGGPDARFLSEQMLLLYDGGNTRVAIDAWFAAAGVDCKPRMEFGSVEAIKELVAAGLGWSILPGLALRRERAGFLTTAPVQPRLSRTLGIVVRRDKHLTRALRETMRCLREFADMDR
ncbi:LysR family transcriptional regulator [Rhizobium mulingense]|uniref:LysR family transcriptional regulator n=1 Tax=Rhizobium mulingense TaxID=3031128 RepID=UPI002B493B48|nr:LysR family transcriptional regulator [Rhizobium sp. MJ21]MEB3047488.1 LysR family transcriptional regulator [Rhizobium sp. MJ21]